LLWPASGNVTDDAQPGWVMDMDAPGVIDADAACGDACVNSVVLAMGPGRLME